MSILYPAEQVVKTYEEVKEERTKEIRVRTPKGEAPEIMVTREILVYQDGVLVSSNTSKIFKITLEDLAAIDKTSIMQEVADIIDAIAPNK